MLTKNKFNEQCITYSQMNLIFNTSIFFRKFTTWIRAYIISRYTGVGTAEELFGRLYLETSNFGDMLHLIFGLDNSNRITLLLNQFTFGIRDLIDAQLSGNREAVNQNVARLYQNADSAAAFLASINPYFNENEWRDYLKTYLQYTLEEANLFGSGNFENEIAVFDRITDLTNKMGYSFAQGLDDYITSNGQTAPAQNGEPCMTLEQVNEIYKIRTIWFDLTTWSRNFMLSKFRGVGDVNDVHARLQQVPEEFVSALKRFFGNQPIFDTYQQALNAYVDLLDSLTTAQMEGNTDEVNRVVRQLYRGADERAAAFASLNPTYWNENELKTRLYSDIRSTIDESTSFLAKDYVRNLDIYSSLLDQAESISGYLADGLVDYINDQRKGNAL